MSPTIRPKLSKSDERKVLSVLHHFQKMNDAWQEVKAPIAAATLQFYGETIYAAVHQSEFSDEEIIRQINRALEAYNVMS